MPQTVGQYLGVDKGPVISQHGVTDEYRKNAPWPDWQEKYCKGCGRLPSFCECALNALEKIPDLAVYAERIKAARMVK